MTTKIDPSDYVVSRSPSGYGVFSVWRDGLLEPYEVRMNPAVCNCPHHLYRLRHGLNCKHHRIVKQKLEEGSVF